MTTDADLKNGEPTKITVGSLFAGIGGIELGLERTGGFETVWQVELDVFCRKVLSKQWPNAERWPDVRSVGENELQQTDLICGGFPCQDIASVNRQGEGIEGERSSLWYEFARIIRELRPRWVLAENVESLRWAGRGFGTVLRDLAEIGYDAEWEVIPAGMVGANHRRSRIFIVAYPAEQPRLQTHSVFESIRERWEAWRSSGRLDWSQAPRSAKEIHSSHVVGGDDGLSKEMDQAVRRLGNAVVPQVAEFIGEQILEAEIDDVY